MKATAINNRCKAIALTGCVFLAAISLQSQGYIVPLGVTLDQPNHSVHVVSVVSGTVQQDYSGFYLRPQGGNTFQFDPFLDEGVRTFFVSKNDPLSFQQIQAQTYAEWRYPTTHDFADGVPFYLGFYTGTGPWDSQGRWTGIYSNPLFGWGEFVNNAGVIQLVDSALEAQGIGIYVGTQNIIAAPEPGVIGLWCLGGVLFARRQLWAFFRITGKP